MWKCPKCTDQVQDNLEACPNCGALAAEKSSSSASLERQPSEEHLDAADDQSTEFGGEAFPERFVPLDRESCEKLRERFCSMSVARLVGSAIESCWLSLDNNARSLDEVERQIRRVVDRVFRAFHDDCMYSVPHERTGSSDRKRTDELIRDALLACWIGLPEERRTKEECERLIHDIVDRALLDFREHELMFRGQFGPYRYVLRELRRISFPPLAAELSCVSAIAATLLTVGALYFGPSPISIALGSMGAMAATMGLVIGIVGLIVAKARQFVSSIQPCLIFLAWNGIGVLFWLVICVNIWLNW